MNPIKLDQGGGQLYYMGQSTDEKPPLGPREYFLEMDTGKRFGQAGEIISSGLESGPVTITWADITDKPPFGTASTQDVTAFDAAGSAAAAQTAAVAASLPLHSKADTAGASDTAVTLAAGADRTKLDGIEPGAQVNVVPNWKCGQTTYNLTTASGVQNIAHGLGRVPQFVRITAQLVFSSAVSMECVGRMCSTGQSGQCIIWTEGASTATTDNIYQSTASAMGLSNAGGVNPFTGATKQSGVITVTATNIIITWTKSGSPTGTANLAWECT